MHIETPTKIQDVAWEGALTPAPTMLEAYSKAPLARPVVTLGRPEVWPAAEALKTEVGRDWLPPQGVTRAWLVRLACTLRDPAGSVRIKEAEERLYLRPRPAGVETRAVTAFSLFPDRLTTETDVEVNVVLGPELTFASGAGVKVGELGATISYRKVFPVIQSYGAGETMPYWIFRPHVQRPLEGSQFVYAVVVARGGAHGVRGTVELVVSQETGLGPLRFGLPDDARAHVGFTLA
jgi:hypothetical protein